MKSKQKVSSVLETWGTSPCHKFLFKHNLIPLDTNLNKTASDGFGGTRPQRYLHSLNCASSQPPGRLFFGTR